MKSTRSTATQDAQDGEEAAARRRILSAAFAAFTENGYAGTSTLEIATRAHVSKRELYGLVGNKQELLARASAIGQTAADAGRTCPNRATGRAWRRGSPPSAVSSSAS